MQASTQRLVPVFEGKESESNWTKRQTILRIDIPKIIDAYSHDSPNHLAAGIRLLIDGILRCAISERTQLSNDACNCLQTIAKALGAGIHPMLDIILPQLIYLCGFTKIPSQKKGSDTVAEILENATYSPRLLHHVAAATEDKKEPPRKAAAGWLQTLLNKYHRHIDVNHGGIELVEKSITAGLNDASTKVREPMRATYWTFAGYWPDRAEIILEQLNNHARKALLTDSNNPNKPQEKRKVTESASSKGLDIAALKAAKKKELAAKKQAEPKPERQDSGKTSTPAPIAATRPESKSDDRPLQAAPVRRRPITVSKLSTQIPNMDTPLLASRPVNVSKSSAPVPVPEGSMVVGQPINVSKSTASVPAPEAPMVASQSIAISKSLAPTPMPEEPKIASQLIAISKSSAPTPMPEEPKVASQPIAISRSPIATPVPEEELVDDFTMQTSKSMAPTPALETPELTTEFGMVAFNRNKKAPFLHPAALENIKNQPLEGADEENKENSRIKSDKRRWDKAELAEISTKSITPYYTDIEDAKRKIARGIANIKSRTMDDYGYRQLQGFIAQHDDIFVTDDRFDLLLQTLFEALETANDEERRPLGRRFDNKFQLMVVIRLMLKHNKLYASAYYPRTLTALITARGNFESRCHIVSAIEDSAEKITRKCKPVDCIDAVLDLLETEENDQAGIRRISMGLHLLAGLITRSQHLKVTGGHEQEKRMAAFGQRCLKSQHISIKRAAIEYCVKLHDIIEPEERFYRLLTAGVEELESLILYYITTRGTSTA